ncbi:uncharacterized protein P884DRAFT_301712 [Thermothelomyces heterothallicus CBS 202.75]|uniref:uncharacterized protein n=1 Tax=Thermothelomyces heterothallicus CBS 202.75 TaxID=1149848 RepID=UPI0037447625
MSPDTTTPPETQSHAFAPPIAEDQGSQLSHSTFPTSLSQGEHLASLAGPMRTLPTMDEESSTRSSITAAPTGSSTTLPVNEQDYRLYGSELRHNRLVPVNEQEDYNLSISKLHRRRYRPSFLERLSWRLRGCSSPLPRGCTPSPAQLAYQAQVRARYRKQLREDLAAAAADAAKAAADVADTAAFVRRREEEEEEEEECNGGGRLNDHDGGDGDMEEDR